MPDVCPIGTEIQTVLVPHAQFPTREKARAWIVEHGFRATKADVGKSVTRFRQIDPDHFEPKSFRTIPLGKSGVQAVIGCPRRESGRARPQAREVASASVSKNDDFDQALHERMKRLLGRKK
jgi:hypothetical protein